MTKIGTFVSFLPPETFLLLVVGAGIALILGAKHIAMLLGATVAAGIFLPPFIESFLDSLPLWLLIVIVVIVSIVTFKTFFALLIGKEGTDHMVGNFATGIIKTALVGSFRLIGWALRAIFRRH